MRIVLLRAVVDDRISVSEFLFGFQRPLDSLVSHYKHCIRPLLAGFVVALGHPTEVFAEGRLPSLRRRRIVH